MTGYVIRLFTGIAPKNNPRLLADNQAQIATNCIVPSGTLRPLKTDLGFSSFGEMPYSVPELTAEVGL